MRTFLLMKKKQEKKKNRNLLIVKISLNNVVSQMVKFQHKKS